MAGSGLLLLLDDIAALMDDVALMSKIAAKKTVGVIGDDLAVNANQVNNVTADRELPIIWAVTKGSFLNKAIIIPIALLLSFFASWAIIPILTMGGAYLCFEGAEKLIESKDHILNKIRKIFRINQKHEGFTKEKRHQKEHYQNLISLTKEDLLKVEKEKISGAIKTDFVLSAEIMIIALGSFMESSLLSRFLSLTLIGIGMTTVVYGFVALIVKLDDIGLWLKNKTLPTKKSITLLFANFLLSFAPKLMKFLTVVGTLAMFSVGGSILIHGLPFIHDIIEYLPISQEEHLFVMIIETAVGIIGGLFLILIHHVLHSLLLKLKK